MAHNDLSVSPKFVLETHQRVIGEIMANAFAESDTVKNNRAIRHKRGNGMRSWLNERQLGKDSFFEMSQQINHVAELFTCARVVSQTSKVGPIKKYASSIHEKKSMSTSVGSCVGTLGRDNMGHMMWTSGETLPTDLTRDVKKKQRCVVAGLPPNFKIVGGRRGPKKGAFRHQMSNWELGGRVQGSI